METDIEAIIQSLVGAIPHTDLSLDELRNERLGKYEHNLEIGVR